MAVNIETDLLLVTTTLHSSATGRTAVVTYACRNDTGASNPATLANTVQDSFADTQAAGIDSNVTIGPSSVILGQGPGVDPLIGTSNIANVAGTVVMASTPPNVALLIRKRTASGGRRNRGRMYLPWAIQASDVNEAGICGAAGVTSAQTRQNAWLARLATDNTDLVIAQRQYDLPWDNPDRVLVAINMGPNVTSVSVDNLVATQRRRLGRS